jgi:hypothetical protein
MLLVGESIVGIRVFMSTELCNAVHWLEGQDKRSVAHDNQSISSLNIHFFRVMIFFLSPQVFWEDQDCLQYR